MIYVMICFATILAGILQGVTGFGAGIVMMIVLPYLYTLPQSAGVSSAISIIICFMMFLKYRKHVDIKNVILPAVLYLIMSSIAIYFSTMVDQKLLKMIFGCFMVLLSIYYLFFNKQQESNIGIFMKLFCIIVSGVCDGLFGIGGPLMVVYFLKTTKHKEEYLGTIQTFFLINVIYTTIFRIFNGILTIELLPTVGLGVIGILLGFFVAGKIVDRLDSEKLKKVTYVVIGLSGILNLL